MLENSTSSPRDVRVIVTEHPSALRKLNILWFVTLDTFSQNCSELWGQPMGSVMMSVLVFPIFATSR